MWNKSTLLILFLTFTTLGVQAQGKETLKTKATKRGPYELITSYYENDFQPFKRKTIYIGASMSLEDRSMENTQSLFETITDGDRTNFDVQLKGGYFVNDYAMVGLNVNVFENKFTGTLLRGTDTVGSQSITRGFSVTPNYRTAIPLTANERLSFFTGVGLTLGRSNTLKREVMNIDEIEKSFSEKLNLKLALSPGITFFAMENFAIEVQLDVVSYELTRINKVKNEVDKSRDLRHNVDFKPDLLSFKFGLAYFL